MTPNQQPTWKPRVLVVDDEADIRTMLVAVLRSDGWEAEDAAGGEEALARCAETYYDAVVLDLRMPGMSGLVAARRLLDSGFAGGLILFSAYLDPGVEQQCQELGVVVVDKVDWQALVDVCREIARAATPKSFAVTAG